MNRIIPTFLLLALIATAINSGGRAIADGGTTGTLLLEDDFGRDDATPDKDGVGNGWGTNSTARAAGNKQVDLDDGAMHVTRHPVADHGVSVFHEVEFRDATIQLRFKLNEKDDLGINIADLEEKSVHAGHLCVARIRLNRVELTDLKTGRMNLELRDLRKEDKLTPEQQQLIASKTKNFDVDLAADQWHDLRVDIKGDTMRVAIDGEPIGQFRSAGIAHPTKRRLRLSVNKSAWVDDVKIWGHAENK